MPTVAVKPTRVATDWLNLDKFTVMTYLSLHLIANKTRISIRKCTRMHYFEMKKIYTPPQTRPPLAPSASQYQPHCFFDKLNTAEHMLEDADDARQLHCQWCCDIPHQTCSKCCINSFSAREEYLVGTGNSALKWLCVKLHALLFAFLPDPRICDRCEPSNFLKSCHNM